MALRDFLRRAVGFFGRWQPPSTITRTQLTPDQLVGALEATPNWKNGVKRLPLDGTYQTPTRDGFRAITAQDLTNLLAYEQAEFDCENFALLFAALAARDYGINTVGVVVDWSGAHAYNVVVYDDQSIEFYEPQSDSFYPPSDFPVDDLHRLEHGRILI